MRVSTHGCVHTMSTHVWIETSNEPQMRRDLEQCAGLFPSMLFIALHLLVRDFQTFFYRLRNFWQVQGWPSGWPSALTKWGERKKATGREGCRRGDRGRSRGKHVKCQRQHEWKVMNSGRNVAGLITVHCWHSDDSPSAYCTYILCGGR